MLSWGVWESSGGLSPRILGSRRRTGGSGLRGRRGRAQRSGLPRSPLQPAAALRPRARKSCPWLGPPADRAVPATVRFSIKSQEPKKADSWELLPQEGRGQVEQKLDFGCPKVIASSPDIQFMDGWKKKKKDNRSQVRRASEMRNVLTLQPEDRKASTSEAWESGRETDAAGEGATGWARGRLSEGARGVRDHRNARCGGLFISYKQILQIATWWTSWSKTMKLG